jgi:hypothetical protein
LKGFWVKPKKALYMIRIRNSPVALLAY